MGADKGNRPAIVAHHNRISATLSEAPETYRPLFDVHPLLGLETTHWLIGFARGRDLARCAWSVVHDPNSPAYRLDEDLGEALCPMPPPEDAAEQAAQAIIGLRTFFQDKPHRSRRRSR